MQSQVQSPEGRELQETSRRWANLSACGALTPGLLSMLALSVGFGGTLALSPSAQAEPTLLAANETTGPTISFQQPTHADQLNGKAQISIRIQGRRYPAKWVELLVDDYAATKGGPVQLEASMLPVAHFEWDTRVYADGPHKLSVIVTDSQGFKGRSDVQVYINNKGGQDIIPPTVRWFNVRNGDVLRGEFPVQVEATDNFGVKWVIVSLNPAISPNMKPALRSALLNIPPYIFRLNTSGLPASRYVLNAEAFDALDNRGAAPPIEVLIGNGNYTLISPRIPDQTGTVAIPQTVVEGSGDKQTGASPAISMGPREAGVADLLSNGPDKNPLPEREPVKPRNFAALPSSESRAMPAMVKMTRAASQVDKGASTTPVLPSETRLAERAAHLAKFNAAQPVGTQRALPRASEVAAPSRHVATLPPLTAPLDSSVNKTRPVGSTQSTLPQAENRIAATPLNEVKSDNPDAPQLSRSASALVASNVARGESHAVKVPISATKLASMPGATPRTLPRTASLPQLTQSSSLINIGITRAFPEIRVRSSLGPTLAVLPAAIKAYPELPSPNLTPKPLPAIPAPLMALNPPLPKTNGELRPLESITVAPVAQWGTKAEPLPVAHTVLRNESLNSIARRYKMPVAVLAAANNLKLTSGVTLGTKLTLPRALQVTYGGQPVKADAASFVMGSVGVTPFRFLFEKQGGKLDWNEKTRKVTAKGPQGSIELTIGSRAAIINEKETMLDMAAFLMSGRTIVPVRFFEQALHAQVEWDPATGRLYVATTGPAPSLPKG